MYESLCNLPHYLIISLNRRQKNVFQKFINQKSSKIY